MRKVKIMLLKVLLFFIAFLVGADELMLGPLLTPIGRELGVQPERVTLFITAYSLALALIAPLLGSLSDRLGRVRIMLPAALLFGAASIATGLVDSFEWGLASRVLTGLASAGMLPIAFAMAADGTGKDAMKRIAWVQSGLTLGMIASPALGALLAQWHSWRAAFILLGLCAWGVAAALALLVGYLKPVDLSLPSLYLRGSFNQWQNIALTREADSTIWSADILFNGEGDGVAP